MFFSFPEDARWNADAEAVEFGVGIREYEGVVRVPHPVFRRFIDGAVSQNNAWTTCTGAPRVGLRTEAAEPTADR